ncbi:putative RING-H2 finger protein ATL12 [Chenopodium quinoa]|uniref:putative RING-H2 finger protein ATL12 n=1 Tax=Chenopodium quinoa TaxID=63459 RepID=UPI000B77F20A|nr:putative RING-H2 finger protein ATL12 [Chenopodium quinoa]
MIFPLMIALISTRLVNAQDNDQHTSTSSNFQPSLFVVIGVLSFMFALTLILLIYAKFFHSPPSAIHSISHNGNTQQGGMFGTNTRFSGIDRAVVNSLPFFRFASLKGSKQGLQCAVCLAEFEEVEILRLLPKCKHGFHIECVDLWLEHHSTCPLCRQRVTVDDLTTFTHSSRMMSMRFIIAGQNKPAEVDEGEASSSFELFLERETDGQSSGSMFSIGGSFRRIHSARKEEEEEMSLKLEQESNKENICLGKVLHRLNHQIVVSDVVFKNRWSDVSSSDLMFLNSEMLGVMTSNRFSESNLLSYHSGEHDQEMDKKWKSDHKLSQLQRSNSNPGSKNDMGFEHLSDTNMNLNPPRRSSLIPADKRAMSEITAFSRFKDLMSMKNKLRQCLANSEINNNYNSDNDDDYVREDVINRRKKWFPIAKRTVQWFANREKNRSQLQHFQDSQTLDV